MRVVSVCKVSISVVDVIRFSKACFPFRVSGLWFDHLGGYAVFFSISNPQLLIIPLDGPDLLAVADYLADRPEVDSGRIGVVGLSLGGHVALNAAHLDQDKFGAIWLDGVQAQQISDFPEAENAGESFATIINLMILNAAEIRLGQSAPPAYIDILAELEELPLVLVAGGLDDFERRVTQKYATVLNDNAQVWIIEDAPHVGGLFVRPDEYSQRMLVFFEESFEE